MYPTDILKHNQDCIRNQVKLFIERNTFAKIINKNYPKACGLCLSNGYIIFSTKDAKSIGPCPKCLGQQKCSFCAKSLTEMKCDTCCKDFTTDYKVKHNNRCTCILQDVDTFIFEKNIADCLQYVILNSIVIDEIEIKYDEIIQCQLKYIYKKNNTTYITCQDKYSRQWLRYPKRNNGQCNICLEKAQWRLNTDWDFTNKTEWRCNEHLVCLDYETVISHKHIQKIYRIFRNYKDGKHNINGITKRVGMV